MSDKCYCGICDRDVPANVDGTPKRHRRYQAWDDGHLRGYDDGPCPGGSNLHGVIACDPMALALALPGNLKTSTLRNSPRWARAEKGDRIYVKEAWAQGGQRIIYRASEPNYPIPWNNSMFAPFSACRTIRTLTAKPHLVRPQELTLDQIMAEGVRVLVHPAFVVPEKGRMWWELAQENARCRDWPMAFRALWCAINGKRSWDANAPAWLIEFEGGEP